LNSIKSDTLGKIVNTFVNNFFPYENRDNIVKEIRDILVTDKANYGSIINPSANKLDQETIDNETVLANTIK
jgi:hypothetical protein